MTTLEITNSSAISKISFNHDESIIGICYTSSNKIYDFYCNEFDDVKTQIIDAHKNDESLGKLIHSFRKDGKLETIIVKTTDESH